MSRRPHRKTLMLCRQVQRAIDFALMELADDERLVAVSVLDVTPAPDADRMLVEFQLPAEATDDEVAQATAALGGAHPIIRGKVGGAISRRRTPDLIFEVSREGD